MRTTRLSKLRQGMKRSRWLRPVYSKLGTLRREISFVRELARPGRFSAYRRNLAASRQLRSQKVRIYAVNLPRLGGFHDLIVWLDKESIHYKEGGFCVYLPPQKGVDRLFGSILSAFPTNSGLKILKDFRAPGEAVYCSTDVNPNSPRLSDWIGYRPQDYLRVANYLYENGLGPRVYDLVEIRTPHNRLTAYVVQHVAGTVPSEGECKGFLARLERLLDDQLIPVLPEWKTAADFLPPDCRGNLIRDEHTHKALYVDFQGFMLKDPRQYVLEVARELREHLGSDSPSWIPGEARSRMSISCPYIGKPDTNTSWNLFKKALQEQGVSVEGSVVLDVGCNAGTILYSALVDGAAWAVGWDNPGVASAARRMLLSLGVTRFDVLPAYIATERDIALALPEYVGSSNISILFYLSMKRQIGFPDSVGRLPFEFMVYEDHPGLTVSEVRDQLKEIEQSWALRVDQVSTYGDGDGREERVIAILHRDEHPRGNRRG